jgi:Putative MetA-pathway of phenol degradation
MFRLPPICILIVGVSLLAGEACGQSRPPLNEVWNDDASDRFVSIGDEEFRRGPLFGAWGEGVPFDPNGEPEPIATDRPDFTESSTTVGAGVAQIEAGYTYTKNADDNLHGHSWGEPLLRVGVFADWLELRAAVAPATEIVNGDSTSGVEDLYLGVKLGLTAQSDWLPEVALVPQMTVPTGSSNFTADRTLPGCNLLYAWDVTDSFSTGGSTQVNLAVDGNDSYVEWAQSWTVGFALADDVGFYTEWFAILPESSSAVASEHYLNSGFTWQPTSDVQWDIRAGTGLNDDAADFFCGVGLSVRFR